MNLPKYESLIICDASPLILLAKIGELKILKASAEEIWIPRAVWEEVNKDVELHPEIVDIQHLFSNCIRASNTLLEQAFNLEVDQGEAAALALALEHPQSCLLMDDLSGRMVAKRQGIRVMGTLGLLVHAKKNGIIIEIKPFFEKLKMHGWYISEKLVHHTLRIVGETFF